MASTETVDRFGEVIMASGWRLENYRRNPVFQNAHQYGDILFTLGKALMTEVREGGGQPHLFQRIEFAVDSNPVARIAYGLYQGGFLNAVSVGFIPIRWEDAPAGQGSAHSGSSHASPMHWRRRYLEQELLEVSAVGIPANPDALQLAWRAGAIEKNDVCDLLDLARDLTSRIQHPASGIQHPASDFCSQPAAPNALTCALGVRRHEAHWLQLARALGELLRRT